MKAALFLTVVSVLSSAGAQGAEHQFDDIVRAVSEQFHIRPLHIPLFGLVNFATAVAHPAGVKHLNLAVFEDTGLPDAAAADFSETIRRSVGGNWKPFVQVRGHGETVLVYMAQDRSDCKLLVANIEKGEINLVELKLNPEGMQAWLREPAKTAVKSR